MFCILLLELVDNILVNYNISIFFISNSIKYKIKEIINYQKTDKYLKYFIN